MPCARAELKRNLFTANSMEYNPPAGKAPNVSLSEPPSPANGTGKGAQGLTEWTQALNPFGRYWGRELQERFGTRVHGWVPET
jgi:hypothetical protein